MRKLKLIYNPHSGDKSFKYNLDSCINIFQQSGYEVHIFRSLEAGDIDAHLKVTDKNYYDTIVISGGDGSINIVVNAIMKYNINAKLGIIPSGTANDFANFLKIPNEPDQAAKIITNGSTIRSDVGSVNDKFFINVCGAGLFTNISQNIDINLKNLLGKMAYYIKGIEQIPNFVSFPIRITNSKEVIEEDIYLYIVLNTAGTGGFENLSPEASIEDGEFDFIAFRARPIVDMAVLFVKILTGDYLNDSGILYFKDNYIKIESLEPEQNKLYLETDIDGELGPNMPIEITNINGAIEIYI